MRVLSDKGYYQTGIKTISSPVSRSLEWGILKAVCGWTGSDIITGSDLNFPLIHAFHMLSRKYLIAYHHTKHVKCLMLG